MRILSKNERFFGPVGSFAGIIILFTALIASIVFYDGSIYSILLSALFILIGAFSGFTYSSIILDTEQRKVKKSTNWFGIIPTGRWIDIQPGMGITISEVNLNRRNYSRGNRVLDLNSHKYIVRLLDEKNVVVSILFISSRKEEALQMRESLSEQLELTIV
jgi:hypothetical protein